jgi:hypothetical protein
MARKQWNPASLATRLPVEEVTVDDWVTWEQHLGVSLIQRSPILKRSSVLRFADGIRIAKSQAGDHRLINSEEEYYILRNDHLEFALEPRLESWVTFLRHVNGALSVDQILRVTGVAERDVWKHLEEAVEYDVLNIAVGPDETAVSFQERASE